jgi:hypothetical protein
MTLSEKGLNFQGEKISEDNLMSGILVLWRKKQYITGNRRHYLVELYKDNKFIRVVSTKHLQLIQDEPK